METLFQRIYRARWNGHRWGATVWREAFGYDKKLLTSTGAAYLISDDESVSACVYLLPPFPKGIRKHRAMMNCPNCGKRVPAGRIHQHKCK